MRTILSLTRKKIHFYFEKKSDMSAILASNTKQGTNWRKDAGHLSKVPGYARHGSYMGSKLGGTCHRGIIYIISKQNHAENGVLHVNGSHTETRVAIVTRKFSGSMQLLVSWPH